MHVQKSLAICMIALIMFSLSSMFIPIPVKAQEDTPLYFKSQVTQFVNEDIIDIQYQPSTDSLMVLTANGTGTGYLYKIENYDTATFPQKELFILSQNMSASASVTDLWCGITDCFVSTTYINGGVPQSIGCGLMKISSFDTSYIPFFDPVNFDEVDIPTGKVYDCWTGRIGNIDGRDSSSLGVGGVTIYAESWETFSSALRTKVIAIGANGQIALGTTMAVVNTLVGNVRYGGSGASTTITFTINELKWSGIAGTTNNYLIMSNTDLAGTNNGRIDILNIASNTQVCSSFIGNNALEDSIGHLFIDRDHFKIYVTREPASGNWRGIGDSATAFNCNGASQTAITPAEHGLSSGDRQVDALIIKNLGVAIFREANQGRFSQVEWNPTTGAFNTTGQIILESAPDTALGAMYAKMHQQFRVDVDGQEFYDTATFVWIPTPEGNILVYGVREDNNQTGGEICFTVAGTGNQICYPTDENGNPIVGSTIEVVTNQNPPVLAIGKLLCQTGFVLECTNGAPTNTNIQTNGSGLILYFVILAVMMAVVGSALYGRIKIEYNLMLQIVVIMIATGIAVAFELIEIMWFYVMVFIIIGFASLAGTAFIMGRTKGRGGTSD